MAKYHFLTGDDLEAMDLTDRVARCVEIKAEVVAADEREGGRRALLNYGHTLAHALEIATEHGLTHGEAVGDRARVRRRAGPPARAHRRRRASPSTAPSSAARTGCRRRSPAGLDADDLVALMARDKKALDGLTFVLDGPDGRRGRAGGARGGRPGDVRAT